MVKEMIVNWDIERDTTFNSQIFLQGDFGIGKITVNISNLQEDFEGRLRATYCNESDVDAVYIDEVEVVGNKVELNIPNEIFEKAGKVFSRLMLRNTDKSEILGNVEEIHFFVAEKEDWELVKPLLPSAKAQAVSDKADELFDLMKNCKKELKEYQEDLKGGIYNVLSVEEAIDIIKKYKIN